MVDWWGNIDMKRGISFLLILVLILIFFSSSVASNAGSVVDSTEYAMFDLYRGLRELGEIDTINSEELFVWGYFLSNYVEPFADGKDKGYGIFLNSKKDYLYYGQPDYKDSLNKLFEKVVQFQFTDRLDITLNDSDVLATFSDLTQAEDLVFKVRVDGENLTVYDSTNDISNLGLVLSLAKGREVLEDIGYSAIQDMALSMDTFGNILLEDDRVVIPAVLNPYIISEEGDKFLFVNDYMLANYGHKVATNNSNINFNYVYNLSSHGVTTDYLDPYNKYLYFNFTKPFNEAGFQNINRIEDLNEFVGGTRSVKFNKFISDYGVPSQQMLFKGSINTDGFTVILMDDFRDIKDRYIGDGGLAQRQVAIKGYYKEMYNCFDAIQASNSNDISVKLFMDSSLLEVDEFNKRGFLGLGKLFNLQTDLGKAIGTKLDKVNEGGIVVDSSKFMSKMSIPEKFETVELLGDTFDTRDSILPTLKELIGQWDSTGNTGLQYTKNSFNEIVDGHIYKIYSLQDSEIFDIFTTSTNSLNTLSDNFITSIYYTYLNLYFGKIPDCTDWAGFNSKLVNQFLEMGEYESLVSGLMTEKYLLENEDDGKEDILKNIKGLLDPDDASYRVKYMNSTTNAWLIDTHYKLSNAYENDATSSSYKEAIGYSGLSNFVTTPSLKETPFISGILDNYFIYYVIVFCIFFVLGIIGFATGASDIKKTGVFLILSAIILMLPPYLIDTAVEITNDFSESVFSGKLSNWALVQYQQYLLDTRTKPSIADSIQMIQGAKSNEGVLLKWGAQKKINPYEDLYTLSTGGGSTINLNIFKWIASGFLQQEFYPDSTSYFLYRSLYDVAKSGKEAYYWYDTSKDRVTTINDLEGKEIFEWVDLEQTRRDMLSLGQYSYFPVFENNVHYTGNLIYKGDSAVDHGVFNSSNSVLDMDMTVLDTKNTTVGGIRNPNEQFLINTESIYYYFYNVIRDYVYEVPRTELEGVDNIGTGFSNLLLGDDIFLVTDRNSKGYKKLKDFLDLEHLFKNVIPYQKAFNTLAMEQINSDIDMTEEEQLRYWAYYTVWVSALDRSEYGKGNTLSTLGKSYKLKNGFDYKEYDTYRPMLFSEAQQYELGYGNVSLSLVESKLQNVLEKTYVDWRYLVNNLGFSDEALITIAALQATFNFNNEFSRNFLFKENAQLYPKGYDLRGFSYDTIMKMLLMTSTGESLFGDEGIYERTINKSSWVSGALLLVSDFIAVVVVSNMRYIFVLLLFFMSYILAFYHGIKILTGDTEGVISKIGKALLIPLGIYILSSFGHATLISLLIGDSYNNLVGVQNTVVLNSPTSLFIWFIIICLVYTSVLIGTLVYMFKDFKGSIMALGLSLWGFAKTSASAIGKSVSGMGSQLGGITGSIKQRLGMDWAVTNNELIKMDRSTRRLESRTERRLAKMNKKGEKDSKYGDYSDDINTSLNEMNSRRVKNVGQEVDKDKDSKRRQELEKRLAEIEKKKKYIKDEVDLRTMGRGK